ncbi:TetR/AcrR family transcriptional regulator [[Clostridium] innocuum]|nr:TetR/AcrR family transcriptional regulator [[Clostridium] innocuum]
MEESVSKRSRIQDAAVALFHEQGVEATSVNEIVRRANVAKGTFYVYYKDKKELISQILTKQHGCLMNDILNHSYEAALANSTCWKRTFNDELITYYIQHPKLLRTIQKNIASILDTKEHRDMVFTHIERMPDFLKLLRREQETEKKALNRFLMMMEIIGFVCYNAIFFEQPDSIEEILPELRETMFKMLERKE